MSIPATDSVGTDVVNNSNSRPWDQPQWLRSRLKELVYSVLSWPYVLALAMTHVFILKQTDLTLQAMIGAWVLAFGRREFANWLASRKQP